MRVVLTGHLGYLGSILAARLIEAGHEVTGLDAGYFDAPPFLGARARLASELRMDLRDVEPADLAGHDAVVHLAALSNDPIGNLNEEWTREINTRASVRLAAAARQAGVARFVFSSSCIMYGAANETGVNEESPLVPRTAYARSKVEAERGIAALVTPDFSPVFLRNGTVYGASPAMRFDTVLNNLTGAAITSGRVVIHGDGRPWRPVVHIEDVAALFLAVLAAPRDRLHNEALNAGSANANHRVMDLARAVAGAVPGARVECLDRADADSRTYRAGFDKIARLLPEFRPQWNIDAGIAQLVRDFRGVGLDEAGFASPRFTRMKRLAMLIESGRVDGALRLRSEVAA